MRCTVFLAVVAAALGATAKPSHSVIAALLHRQQGASLHAREGINPSSVSPQCQPSCTTIIKKLDACTAPTCECTQANYEALGVCINCLVALGPPPQEFDSPGESYLDGFDSACSAFGIVLNAISVTASPTGVSSTGDPLAVFEAPTPTAGATVAVTDLLPPLYPTSGINTPNPNGSAAGPRAFWALGPGAGAMVATAATAITLLGASFL